MAYNRREWQAESVTKFFSHTETDYLVGVAPAGGKTKHACDIARMSMDRGLITRVIFVVISRNIGDAFREEGLKHGLDIDWIDNGAGTSKMAGSGRDGYITTYQAMASLPLLYARKVAERPTMVVFDEVHHLGDYATWGKTAQMAFGAAKKRVHLTGTAYRSDGTRIPFLTYTSDGRAKMDYSYDWSTATVDGIIRRVGFHDVGADVIIDHVPTALGAIPPGAAAEAFQQAYHSSSSWVAETLRLAISDLNERRLLRPTAAGLVIARDQYTADQYAKVMDSMFGVKAVVIHSGVDVADCSREIKAFKDGTDPWLISVRMIAEGVDIPRLETLVWASTFQTPLAWQQGVGRVVRKIPGEEAVEARVFFPGVPGLVENARDMEREIRLAADRRAEALESARQPSSNGASGVGTAPAVIPATDGRFERAFYGNEEIPAAKVARIEDFWVSKGQSRLHAISAWRSGLITETDLFDAVDSNVVSHVDLTAKDIHRKTQQKEFGRVVKVIASKLMDSGDVPADVANPFRWVGGTLQKGAKVRDMTDAQLDDLVRRAHDWLAVLA